MTGVVVVLVVVVLVTLINFFLLLAILRRVAVHQRRLDEFDQQRLMTTAPDGLPVGLAAPAFRARTADGSQVSEQDLDVPLVALAFFSTSCRSCLEHAPEFVATARATGAAPWAVVVGPTSQGAALFEALGEIPVINVAEFEDELVTHYAIDTFPTFYLLRDGVISGQAGSAAELAAVADSARAG